MAERYWFRRVAPDEQFLPWESAAASWLQGRAVLDENGFVLTGRDLPLRLIRIGILLGRFRARL